jgi:hypothetical protein
MSVYNRLSETGRSLDHVRDKYNYSCVYARQLADREHTALKYSTLLCSGTIVKQQPGFVSD